MLESMGMVKAYGPGIRARREILRELRRREDADEPVSVDALAEGTGLPRGTVARHLAILRRACLIKTRHGHGGGIWLTDAGRIATD